MTMKIPFQSTLTPAGRLLAETLGSRFIPFLREFINEGHVVDTYCYVIVSVTTAMHESKVELTSVCYEDIAAVSKRIQLVLTLDAPSEN